MKTEDCIREKIEGIEAYQAKLSKWSDEYPFAYHAIKVLEWVLEESTDLDNTYTGEP